MKLGIWLFALWGMGMISGLSLGGLVVYGAQPKWVASLLVSLFVSAICARFIAKPRGAAANPGRN